MFTINYLLYYLNCLLLNMSSMSMNFDRRKSFLTRDLHYLHNFKHNIPLNGHNLHLCRIIIRNINSFIIIMRYDHNYNLHYS